MCDSTMSSRSRPRNYDETEAMREAQRDRALLDLEGAIRSVAAARLHFPRAAEELNEAAVSIGAAYEKAKGGF